jgi:hypothetical protein
MGLEGGRPCRQRQEQVAASGAAAAVTWGRGEETDWWAGPGNSANFHLI